jgi:hypothetical protein
MVRLGFEPVLTGNGFSTLHTNPGRGCLGEVVLGVIRPFLKAQAEPSIQNGRTSRAIIPTHRDEGVVSLGAPPANANLS